jgi:integrase
VPYVKNSYQKQFTAKFGSSIESYASIQRAIENLKQSGKRQYYCELPRYFMFLNQTPDQVIAQRRFDLNKDEAAEFYEKKTVAYAKFLLEKGIAGKTVGCQVGRIQGFFSNNSRRYALDMRSLKIPKARKKRKYSPSNDDVRLLYSLADSCRDRLIVTLMYQCGPAPIDVAALNVGDLPVESWSYFEFSRSKTGEIWRSVVTPDISCELKAYLKVRASIVSDLVAN